MNMKKTIAAVAACAVATSAMATTVFADDSVTLHYNLTRSVYAKSEGSVTYQTTIDHKEATEDGGYVQIQFKDVSGNHNAPNAKFTVTGYNVLGDALKGDTFSFVDYTEGSHTWELTRSSQVKNEGWGPATVMTIPVDDKGIKAAEGGFVANVSVTVPHRGNEYNGADLAAEISYVVGTELAALVVTDKSVAGYKEEDGVPTLLLGDVVDPTEVVDGSFIGYPIDVNGDGTVDNNVVTEIYAAPNVVKLVETGSELPGGDLTKIVLHTTMSAWSGRTETQYKFPMATTANTTTTESYPAKYFALNTKYGGSDVYTSEVVNGVYVYPNIVRGHNEDKSQTYYYNGLNVNGSNSNILDYLSRDSFNLSANGKSYLNVVPVINDVIANYDDVTFTFNTAADGLNKVKIDYTTDAGTVTMAGLAYDANGDKTFTKFTQHLYNLYGDEATEYVYAPTTYDWSTYNLWAGALVVNGTLTMSLQDTNVFDYGATTLSFNWTDAIDGAVVHEYATYLTKMQLATSSVWYWDSLDITGAASEDEDVKAEAGVEAEEDVIEEDVEEDVIEEDIEEDVVEEDVEEDVVVDEPVVEEVPVVENPGTGNAPVALAVIPVALAAAAVVAKKRG